jgi:hypothetical protein
MRWEEEDGRICRVGWSERTMAHRRFCRDEDRKSTISPLNERSA